MEGGERLVMRCSPPSITKEDDMLFNPRWDSTTDPFALGSLIEWLERKLPYETYEYSSCSECLLSQYFRDKGFSNVHMCKTYFSTWGLLIGKQNYQLPEHFNAIAQEGAHNFGSALRRARGYRHANA
jgi:hypothetical protein